jgi:vacuolar iron transporter family protein
MGEYVKSMVFGGLDGIITTFAIVAACVGGKLLTFELIVVGFANLIGDVFFFERSLIQRHLPWVCYFI